MNRCSRPFGGVLVGVGLALLAFELPAMAADLPLKAPAAKTVYDWTGFYLGGHVGYGGGSFGPGTNPLPEQGVFFPHSITGVIGGYQAGYLRQLSSHVVLGIEADASFTGPLDVPALIPAPFHTTIDYVGTVRARAGYASGTLLAYVTGGFAWGHSHININDAPGAIVSSPGQNQLGWTAGAGVEFAVSGNWSAKLEYDYTDLARRTYDLSGFGLPAVNVDPNIHLVKLGLNYRFGDPAMDRARRSENRRCENRASGIDRLERARADHLSSDRLSRVPLALCRAQQSAGQRTGA